MAEPGLQADSPAALGASAAESCPRAAEALTVASPVTGVRTRAEVLPVGMHLAGPGGFLDAYTFVGYNGVFANARTGNVVLLGVDVQAGAWDEALLHIPPILAFALGVALAHILAHPPVRKVVRRPTRWVLIAEIAVLAVVGATSGGIPSRVVPGAAIVLETRRLDRADATPQRDGPSSNTWS
jgi:hypothetical protein